MFNKQASTFINNKKFSVELLGAYDAIKLAKRIEVVLIPILGGSIIGENYVSIASKLASGFDNFEMLDLVKTLLKGAVVQTQEYSCDLHDNFDLYFMANYGELTKVLSFVIAENFSDYFLSNRYELEQTNKQESGSKVSARIARTSSFNEDDWLFFSVYESDSCVESLKTLTEEMPLSTFLKMYEFVLMRGDLAQEHAKEQEKAARRR